MLGSLLGRRKTIKVIVTGGSGRVGRYLVRELAEAGHDVVNVDRARPPEPLPGRSIWLDLTDAGEVYDAFAQVRPAGVCHVAANPSPGKFSLDLAGDTGKSKRPEWFTFRALWLLDQDSNLEPTG
jgi:nucleoside-diphosphate-sugar epimerase